MIFWRKKRTGIDISWSASTDKVRRQGDPAVFEEKIPIEGDQAAYYTSQITGLSQNTEYEIHVLGKAMGSDTLKELLDNDRNGRSRFHVLNQTMDGMDITGIKASDIGYCKLHRQECEYFLRSVPDRGLRYHL